MGLWRKVVVEVYVPAATYALDSTVHLRTSKEAFGRLTCCLYTDTSTCAYKVFLGGRGAGMVLFVSR
jgi:hypothetical protein